MSQSHHINRVRLKSVYQSLGELKDKVVFVGGSTVSLYADVPTLDIRPTDDIDVIIEILNYSHRTELESKLFELGFQSDIESGIVCRYKIKGIVVDVMPTTADSIGFSNIWYPIGFKTAIDFPLDEVRIKIMNAPLFIATKLEAFKNRGKDGRTSSDFEDIVYILENRENIWEELSNSLPEVIEYLKEEFRNLSQNPNLFEWIDCHVQFSAAPPTYSILEEIDKFINTI